MAEEKKVLDLDNRKKALELALAQIEKQFGKHGQKGDRSFQQLDSMHGCYSFRFSGRK